MLSESYLQIAFGLQTDAGPLNVDYACLHRVLQALQIQLSIGTNLCLAFLLC